MRILVADDNPINQKLIYYSLKQFFDIEVANNGEEVLSLLQVKPIDLILMDLAMPVMDGAETTEKIRLMEKNTSHRIPILFVTTSDFETDRQRCLALGADEYLVKPVNTETLLGKINSYINFQPVSI